MIELSCPACRLPNAVRDDTPRDHARCAACEGALDPQRQVLYRVAGDGVIWGPQVLGDLAMRVRRGSLLPDMEIREEGGPWFRAREREELFPWAVTPTPPARPAAPDLPSAPRRSFPVAPRPPPAVDWVAGLLSLVGGLAFVAAAAGFVLGASLSAFGAGLLVASICGVVAFGLFALARALRRGSSAARWLTLVLAFALTVPYLALVVGGLGALWVLLAGGLLVSVWACLLGAQAETWFRRRSAP